MAAEEIGPDRAVPASGDDTVVVAAKQRLRAQLLARRRTLTDAQVTDGAAALRAVACAVPAVAGADTVALYLSTGAEPGTGPLLADLHERGVRVLLPVLCLDLDLDWAGYAGPAAVEPGPRATVHPTGPRLGRDAIAAAGAVLVPGVAVGRDGTRLGRGGGSYDRALRRVDTGAFTAVLLYPEELLDAVPSQPHDTRVHGALTPRRWLPLPAPGGVRPC